VRTSRNKIKVSIHFCRDVARKLWKALLSLKIVLVVKITLNFGPVFCTFFLLKLPLIFQGIFFKTNCVDNSIFNLLLRDKYLMKIAALIAVILDKLGKF
jgi:hypothetical protein